MPDERIDVPYPAADDLHLRIVLGACSFEGKPGEAQSWVTGTCHDPTDRRGPRILTEGGTATITEEKPSIERMPDVFGGVPLYKVECGKRRAFALTIETGASEFDFDLGDVPLKVLKVRQGAGRFNLNFSTLNPEPMSLLEVSSGAAGIELRNLSNAHFSQMRLRGGAAGCRLDFGGKLKRDADVTIEAGLSGVEIAVPGSTAAKIVAETALGSVDVGDGFTKREGSFLTEACLAGKKPLLTIRAEVRMGALEIKAT